MIKFFSLLIIALILISCTAGPNELVKEKDKDGDIAGFFMGFWHGLICIFTLIISIFTDKVNIYEVHNIGFWYDLGFLLGAGTLTGGTLWSRKKSK